MIYDDSCNTEPLFCREAIYLSYVSILFIFLLISCVILHKVTLIDFMCLQMEDELKPRSTETVI